MCFYICPGTNSALGTPMAPLYNAATSTWHSRVGQAFVSLWEVQDLTKSQTHSLAMATHPLWW